MVDGLVLPMSHELEDDVAELIEWFICDHIESHGIGEGLKGQFRDALAKFIDERVRLLVPILTCPHRWVRRRVGGAPDMPDSLESVEYCELCGTEREDD